MSLLLLFIPSHTTGNDGFAFESAFENDAEEIRKPFLDLIEENPYLEKSYKEAVEKLITPPDLPQESEKLQVFELKDLSLKLTEEEEFMLLCLLQ